MADFVSAKSYKSSDISPLVEQLHFVGIKTIGELSQALQEREPLILWQWKQRMTERPPKRESLIRGICLFHLFQVLVAMRQSTKEMVSRNRFDIECPNSETL